MSTHSLFAPSAASRWMACPGSMAFSENREQGESNDMRTTERRAMS